jgi:hypothetical protein
MKPILRAGGRGAMGSWYLMENAATISHCPLSPWEKDTADRDSASESSNRKIKYRSFPTQKMQYFRGLVLLNNRAEWTDSSYRSKILLFLRFKTLKTKACLRRERAVKIKTENWPYICTSGSWLIHSMVFFYF